MSEVAPPSDLTGFQRDLLVVVARLDGAKGLTIKSELERFYRANINHGRLYPNLDDLAEMGLIDKSSRDLRTNEYRITARGRRELSQYIQWLIRSTDEEGDR